MLFGGLCCLGYFGVFLHEVQWCMMHGFEGLAVVGVCGVEWLLVVVVGNFVVRDGCGCGGLWLFG